jgi:small GTP-binding protein
VVYVELSSGIRSSGLLVILFVP